MSMEDNYPCDDCGDAFNRDEVTRTQDGGFRCDDCALFGPPSPVTTAVATLRCALAGCAKPLEAEPAAAPVHVQWHCVDERAYCSVFCFMADGACPCRRSHCE